MDRRTFAGRLLASLAGVAIAPEALLWKPVHGDLPPLRPQALVGLPAITERAAHILDRMLQHGMIASPLVHADPAHFGVALSPPDLLDEHGLDPHEYLEPAMHLLANEIRERRHRRMSPVLVLDGDTRSGRPLRQHHARTDRVHLRGVAYWESAFEGYVLGFHVDTSH